MAKTRSYPVAVVGESFANDDGTSRQAIIARLAVGDAIMLMAEPDNPHDAKAVAVHHALGQIGYVARDKRWLGDRLARGETLVAKVHAINGGAGAPIGVVVWVTVPLGAGKAEGARPAVRPTPPRRKSPGAGMAFLKMLAKLLTR